MSAASAFAFPQRAFVGCAPARDRAARESAVPAFAHPKSRNDCVRALHDRRRTLGRRSNRIDIAVAVVAEARYVVDVLDRELRSPGVEPSLAPRKERPLARVRLLPLGPDTVDGGMVHPEDDVVWRYERVGHVAADPVMPGAMLSDDPPSRRPGAALQRPREEIVVTGEGFEEIGQRLGGEPRPVSRRARIHARRQPRIPAARQCEELADSVEMALVVVPVPVGKRQRVIDIPELSLEGDQVRPVPGKKPAEADWPVNRSVHAMACADEPVGILDLVRVNLDEPPVGAGIDHLPDGGSKFRPAVIGNVALSNDCHLETPLFDFVGRAHDDPVPVAR